MVDTGTPTSRILPPRTKLLVASGPSYGLELMLEVGSYSIGKDAANDLVLDDPEVSRVHLLIEVLKTGLRLIDPGSTNGSFHEGARFSRIDLVPPATVRIGTSELRFVLQPT